MLDDSIPIFMQLVDQLRVEIAVGTYPDGAKAPSINELAVFHRTNLAIANRAIALLVGWGVLIERRGIGMFVTDDARPHLIEERRQILIDRHIRPLIAETVTLGISRRELIAFIQKEVNP